MDQREIFLEHTAQTSPHPLGIEVEKAEGCYIYSPNGKKYLDLISGISVTNVGHRHPKVVEAIKKQCDKFLHVMAYGEYIQQPVNDLALKLISLLPATLNTVYFVNSGTEANEGAIKLAKRATGRREIIAFHRSYHGNTQGSLSVSGNEAKKNAFRPLLPEVRFLDFDASDQLEEISDKTAAVIVEPIQGDAGVRIPSQKFLQELREKCNETGALLIFDEIQTGFGRTGKLFAFEHYEIIPDILTMAKGMGGGLPIGAFVADSNLMKLLSHDPMLGHITTFGGNPVCCAAAQAVLEILVVDRVIEAVESKGQLFENLLKHDLIIEMRRKGLMMAVEFENEKLVQEIVERCIDKGVITYFFLSTRHSFRLAPPLTISENEIDYACKVILEVLDSVSA